MPKLKFTALLEDASNGFVCLTLPQNALKKFGQRKRTPVAGKINNFAIRTSVFPDGKGNFIMLVNKEMQQGAKCKLGDTVKMELEVDSAPRVLALPPDVQKAINKNKPAKAAFDKLPYSHQKEYLDYVLEAKKPETRARRIEKTVAQLAGIPK